MTIQELIPLAALLVMGIGVGLLSLAIGRSRTGQVAGSVLGLLVILGPLIGAVSQAARQHQTCTPSAAVTVRSTS